MASEAHDLSEWSWLHPASVVVNLLPRAWRVVRGLWPLALALLWRGGSGDDAEIWADFIDVGVILIFFLATVGGTLIHWLTLRYRVHSGRLEIRTGLLNRTVRTIDPGRIQNVELVRTVSHRISGLVEVRIETASGTEVEGLLSALTVERAELIRRRLETLRAVRRAEVGVEPVPDELIVEHSVRDLFVYGATAGRLGAAAVVLGLVFEAVSWVAPERLGSLALEGLGVEGLLTGVLVLTGAWLFGLGGTVVRYWGFRLSRSKDGLVVESGLFTRRRLELPLRKVQVVESRASLIRRLIGFGSVTIETAAARSGQGGTERRAAITPVVPLAEIAGLARLAIPDLDVDPWNVVVRRAHRRALHRQVGRAAVRGLLILVAAMAFLGTWGALAIVVVPLSMAAAVLDWQHQGWLLTDRVVVARRGFLNRRLTVVSRRKLQAVDVRQGLILRRLGLGEVVVKVAGTSVVLPLMTWREAQQVMSTLAGGLLSADDSVQPAHVPVVP